MTTMADQMRNRVIQSNNTSGAKGVYKLKKQNGWGAKIGVDGEQIYLGVSQSFDGAVQIRKAGEIKYWGKKL